MNAYSAGFAGLKLVKAPLCMPRLVPMDPPIPGPGEVRVRVATVGMCRTDLLVASGRICIDAPTTLGHEFSGWIDAVGENTAEDVRCGDLVAGDPTFPKADGRDAFIGVDADGALATWIVLPAARVHQADGLTPRQAAYLEPVTAAMGGMGIAQSLRGKGAIVGANRIATLTSAVMTKASNPVAHEVLSERELADAADCSFDWIIETCLSEDLVRLFVRKLKAGGTLVIKSRHLDKLTIPVRDVVLKRISLVGRTRSEFPEAMDWIKANPEIVEDLLGPSFSLEDWSKGFEAALSGEGKKVFIDIASGF